MVFEWCLNVRAPIFLRFSFFREKTLLVLKNGRFSFCRLYPQAGLMATLSKGIIGGEMAWALIIAGMIMGVSFILMGIKSPMLIFVGMYLPFNTVFAIFVGGLIKGVLDMYVAQRRYNEKQLASVENTGVLLASGLIAGEALMGLVVAIFAMFNIFFSEMLGLTAPSYWVGLVIIAILAYFMVSIPARNANSVK